jgi:phosphatidate cytidylyltransferase
MGEFKKRIWSALAVGPFMVLLFAFLPAPFFLLFMGLVLGLAAHEWASMTQTRDALLVVVLAVVSLVPLYMDRPALYLVWLLFSPALYLLLKIVRPDNNGTSTNQAMGRFIVVLLLSEVFLGFPLFSFYRLKDLDPYLPVILLLIIWASDTAAYLTGRSLGRHKLAPLVSPKKTIEGLLGAMAGALIVAVLFRHRIGMTAFSAAGVGAAIGILGQLGDMLESIAKRVCNVKDSSSLIPGHGGILDRLDSFLLTAPFLYHCVLGFAK